MMNKNFEIYKFADRAWQQSLILADFIEGHCSKAEALAFQLKSIIDDLAQIKHLLKNNHTIDN